MGPKVEMGTLDRDGKLLALKITRRDFGERRFGTETDNLIEYSTAW
jgi:hypothetical protein